MEPPNEPTHPTAQRGELLHDLMPVARKHGYLVMPVVDEDGSVLGVIRLQDLIEI